ncbi:MAG: LacI family transcriptional regulator [Opitutaceae bacterium]|jgi:LacI family transcriptional regulator|nr:LacI family transcriptional regulator [Opitutaceae bacterium]
MSNGKQSIGNAGDGGKGGGPRIALKEVAEAAGVSRMTVSLALRNHPALAAATGERVRAVAARLGYQPDPEVGRVMAQIRTRRRVHRPATIAWLTAHATRSGWKKFPTQVAYREGAARRADACGYKLEEFWLNEPGMSERRLADVVRNRGINGVIVAPLPVSSMLFQDFRWEWFSVVELGYSLPSPALSRACSHQFQSMQLLVEQLRKQGHRRIGFAMEEDQDFRVRHNWRGGYLSACSLLSDLEPVPMLLDADWTRERFDRWRATHRPDVILTTGPEVLGWIPRNARSNAPEVAVALVNLDSVSVPDRPWVSGIDQNSTQVGAAGVDLLISLMNANERGIPKVPRILMVEGGFVQAKRMCT